MTRAVHYATYVFLPIDMPSSATSRLAIKDSKLIESKFLLQSATHGYARLACSDNHNRNVGNGISVVSIESRNGVGRLNKRGVNSSVSF